MKILTAILIVFTLAGCAGVDRKTGKVEWFNCVTQKCDG